MLLTGALFGVMFNGMLPSVVILLILIFVLSLGAYKTGKRALKITRSEKNQSMADLKGLNDENDQVAQNVEMVTSETVKPTDVENAGAETTAVKTAVDEPEVAVTVMDWEWVEWKKLGTVSLLWLVLSISVIVRGSTPGSNSLVGIPFCSAGFWGVYAAIPCVQICFSAYFGYQEINRTDFDDAVALQRSSSKALLDYAEVTWNWANVARYMIYAFVCGLLAGCLGIGGGLVLSPLLLELGFYPAVASGISGMAVLVTSTSALFAYGLANKVYWEFVILLMPLTFCSTMVGKILIDRYAERNNKQSAIIWSVAIFLMVCLIMLTARGLVELIDDPSFEFSSPCE